jgi:hypothetical protein
VEAAERAAAEAFWRQEEEAIRRAEEEEEARRKLRKDIVLKLKEDRFQQASGRGRTGPGSRRRL